MFYGMCVQRDFSGQWVSGVFRQEGQEGDTGLAEEMPELGERTDRRRLPAVHHQTVATSSSQYKILT
eukprot:10654518-Ditylum_brightwellii.AAC.1